MEEEKKEDQSAPFEDNLFSSICRMNQGNLICSPLSILNALTICMYGRAVSRRQVRRCSKTDGY